MVQVQLPGRVDPHLEPSNGSANGFLTVRARNSKNSKSRSIPLTKRVRAMPTQRQSAGYVFQREVGLPLYQTWLNQQHSSVREALNLPGEFVLHSLRHTFGTRLGESGADEFTIMRLMGHSTVIVSQRYVHPSSESVERAVQRLDSLNRGKGDSKGKLQRVGTKIVTVEPTTEEAA